MNRLKNKHKKSHYLRTFKFMTKIYEKNNMKYLFKQTFIQTFIELLTIYLKVYDQILYTHKDYIKPKLNLIKL